MQQPFSLAFAATVLGAAALFGCDLSSTTDGPRGGGGAGGGGAGGDTPNGDKPRQGPPANVVGGFVAEMPPSTLAPGDETYPCMIIPLELEGPSRIVGGGSVTVGNGMHHGNITARPKTGEGVRPCPAEEGLLGGEAGDILKGGAVLFGSTTQFEGTEWRTFPDGMGFPIGTIGKSSFGCTTSTRRPRRSPSRRSTSGSRSTRTR
ncbi:MAG: hypothetical protein IPM79_08090 [Polyangiaceae bacterium]|jgi:hypothetical protein|nr:hypothetical protein [Polyangiaceae bacterium]MBK8937592.1 hypothetical protein [Polyangiaceae bacterium]